MTATGFALGMTAPLEVLYARRFGAGTLEIALFLMCSAVSVLLVDVFGTRVVPNIEARRALTAGILIFGAASVAFATAPTFPPLLLARIAQGFGAAILGGAALQASVRVEKSREHALGSVQSRMMLGGAVGAPFGGLVAAVLPGMAGYRLAFALCATASAGIGVALRSRLPRLESASKVQIGLPRFTGHGAIRHALLLGILGNYLRSGVENTAVPLVGDSRGYSTALIGLTVGLLSAVEIATLRSARRIFSWVDPARCLMSASAIGIAAAALLALVPGRAAYFVAALLFGLVVAISMVAPPLIILSLSSDTRDGLASYRIACGVGSLTGASSVNAAVAAIGAAGVLAAVGGVLLAGIALVTSIGRRAVPAPD